MILQFTSWVEFTRLLEKIEEYGVNPRLISIQRKRLSEPENYDVRVKTGLRYKDYTLLAATIYEKKQ
jgi:hypothetical protein